MGRKRRSIHNPKFAKRLKYAALRKESNPDVEEDIDLIKMTQLTLDNYK